MQLLIVINPFYHSAQNSLKKAKTALSKRKQSTSVAAKAISVKKPVIRTDDSDGGADSVMYVFFHASPSHIFIITFMTGLIMYQLPVLTIALMERRQLR